MNWQNRLRHLFIQSEPAVPPTILDEAAEKRFADLPAGGSVCLKVSAAYDLPYPFAVSSEFAAQAVAEIHAANPGLKILLTEGGVGTRTASEMAERHGLTAIPQAEFVDAEATEAIFVPNPNPKPFTAEGFWLPAHWVNASARVLLTTCKVRSHHWERNYSGGARNLIGLLPRERYRLTTSRRNMRSLLHQNGVDATVADLYATTGQNALTILDGRLLARQDEHLPIRYTRSVGRVIVADDPCQADERMVKMLGLPFLPPYLRMISRTGYRGGVPAYTASR